MCKLLWFSLFWMKSVHLKLFVYKIKNYMYINIYYDDSNVRLIIEINWVWRIKCRGNVSLSAFHNILIEMVCKQFIFETLILFALCTVYGPRVMFVARICRCVFYVRGNSAGCRINAILNMCVALYVVYITLDHVARI